MTTLGGPAQPVAPVSDDRPQQGGAAIPVAIVSGRPSIGGPARSVYVVTSGPVRGGPALPIVAAPYGAVTDGGPALPVYVVSGYLGSAYAAKVQSVLPANLIAYWPEDELSGTVITDRSGNNRNGVYSAVTLGQQGIGDGRTAASFNGSTSYGNVYSASLAAAFNGQEGSLAGWFRVSGAGVWTDGLTRRGAYFLVDSSNRLGFFKPTTSNEIDCLYVAGGVSKGAGKTSFSSTGWFHLGLTWSKAADQMIFYVDGVAITPISTGLGTFAGSLSTTQTVLGSLSVPAAQVWSGLEAHVALWNTPITAAQMALLAAAP